jgi:two-component system, NtrC family, sensor histidine kinase GlrK
MKNALKVSGFRYPGSFLTLLLLGFALVSMPLILTLLDAIAYVDQLNTRSQTAVEQAAEAARSSRVLMEQVTTMELLARQYLILGDDSLLAEYAQVRHGFKQTTSDMSLLPLGDAQLRALNRTIDKEQALFEQLSAKNAKSTGRRPVIKGYIELSELANSVLKQSNLLIDREIEHMGTVTRRAQRSLLWQFAASIPLGVLIAALFAFLIAKPIRQLDQAIRQLGNAELATGIRVHGPADLEYLGQRLEWLRQRLVELEEQKTKFLHHVSHELKTPLTALREGSELLADGSSGALNRQQGEIAEILRDNSLRLQHLIEGLLDYQQALDSVNRLELRPVDLADIVGKVTEEYKLAIAARKLNLNLNLTPAILTGDADKLHIVVDNLLSNAVKYSPEGGTISFVVRTENDKIIVEVGDAGPGIAAEDSERVFDWFFQGKLGHQGRIKGSGLGLAIAREIVLAHRGNIEMIANRGPGAHFRVNLPVVRAPGTA